MCVCVCVCGGGVDVCALDEHLGAYKRLQEQPKRLPRAPQELPRELTTNMETYYLLMFVFAFPMDFLVCPWMFTSEGFPNIPTNIPESSPNPSRVDFLIGRHTLRSQPAGVAQVTESVGGMAFS